MRTLIFAKVYQILLTKTDKDEQSTTDFRNDGRNWLVKS